MYRVVVMFYFYVEFLDVRITKNVSVALTIGERGLKSLFLCYAHKRVEG